MIDKEYIKEIISRITKKKADGQSFSGEFTIDSECREGLNELLLEFLYGDRIRKTIERLNNEWLKKMWKASEYDFRVFWFEQIRKKFEEHEDQNGLRWQI